MKAKKTCEGCFAMCCRYVITEIDIPESLEDFENIKWYVSHKNVNVYVDGDYAWYIEFLTPCEHLGEDNKCKIYEKRPKVCRDYSTEECLFHNPDYEEKYTFKKLEDVENYIENIFKRGLHILVKDE